MWQQWFCCKVSFQLCFVSSSLGFGQAAHSQHTCAVQAAMQKRNAVLQRSMTYFHIVQVPEALSIQWDKFSFRRCWGWARHETGGMFADASVKELGPDLNQLWTVSAKNPLKLLSTRIIPAEMGISDLNLVNVCSTTCVIVERCFKGWFTQVCLVFLHSVAIQVPWTAGSRQRSAVWVLGPSHDLGLLSDGLELFIQKLDSAIAV